MSFTDKILLAVAITAAMASLGVGIFAQRDKQRTIIVRQEHKPYPQVGDVYVSWSPERPARVEEEEFPWLGTNAKVKLSIPRSEPKVVISRIVSVTNGIAVEAIGIYQVEQLTDGWQGQLQWGPATNWQRTDREDVLINRP